MKEQVTDNFFLVTILILTFQNKKRLHRALLTVSPKSFLSVRRPLKIYKSLKKTLSMILQGILKEHS